MNAYRVRYAGPSDSTLRSEVLDAASDGVLRQELEQRGFAVLSVKAVGRPSFGEAAQRPDYSLLCRELRTLLRAGMTVVEAVDTLAAKSAALGQVRREAIASLQSSLQTGQSFSQALQSQPHAPAVLLAVVRAGERTSQLADALDDYLKFDELISRLRGKVLSASIYPGLVTVLGVSISIFLLVVVMPNFAKVYDNVRGQGVMAGAWIVRLSTWMSLNRGFVFAVFALLALAFAVCTRSGSLRRFASRGAVRLPWLRARIEDFQLAIMYQALSVLLKGGFPMTDAMQTASRSALSARLQQSMDAAVQRVTQGTSVSEALASAQLCDEVDRRLMAAAERNGEFHSAADVISRIHGERFELFVERATRIVEPVLLLGVALMVGTIVITMYLPVFDIATQLR